MSRIALTTATDGDGRALSRRARIEQPAPLVLVARFGSLAFGLDDRGLHIVMLWPHLRELL